MEGLVPIRPDEWHAITARLDMKSLCALMRTSRNNWHLFVADRAWATQRHRICARFPALEALFEEYAGAAAEHTSSESKKRNSNKKRKTPWLAPRHGTWYVFKRWLARCYDVTQFRELLRVQPHQPGINALIYAALCAHIPYNKAIEGADHVRSAKRGFRIVFTLAHHHKLVYNVAYNVNAMWVWMICCEGEDDDDDDDLNYMRIQPTFYTLDLYAWQEDWMPDVDSDALAGMIFKPWLAFVFDETLEPHWSPTFVDFMQKCATMVGGH